MYFVFTDMSAVISIWSVNRSKKHVCLFKPDDDITEKGVLCVTLFL